MDNTQWAHQGIGLMPMEEEELLHNSEIRAPILLSQQQQQQLQEVDRKAPTPRPQKEQALHCPRCNSTNTKFCYYNNYSLTQPRYFCKTCRRYWTAGGSLRNVPVGGGSRKNKRHSSTKINIPPPPPPQQDSSSIQDLNLALIPNHHRGFDTDNNIIGSGGGGGGGISAMELLRSTGVGPMMSMMPGVPPPPPDSSGVLHGNGLYNFDHRRVVFPFGELKQEQHRGQLQAGDPTMFWNGMNMGGGGGGGGGGSGSW